MSTKVGPFSPGFQTAESTLDIEYVGAVGVGNDNWYWTTDYWMYEFSQQVFQRQKVPYVISMSYGWSEADQCEIDQEECSQLGVDSQGFVTRVNKEFQKIGARGVTLLASSGDSGAHGRTDKLCFSKVVHPTYPAGSPFVLAVGATQITGGTSGFSNVPIWYVIDLFCVFLTFHMTHRRVSYSSQLTPGCAESGTEVVASTATGAMITSGGGFSVYAERPAWQKNAVDAYVNGPAAKPAKSDYNSAGRGYPDVAALGHKYYIQLDGESVGVDGTSASSPAFAGVIGLLNAYLLEVPSIVLLLLFLQTHTLFSLDRTERTPWVSSTPSSTRWLPLTPRPSTTLLRETTSALRPLATALMASPPPRVGMLPPVSVPPTTARC